VSADRFEELRDLILANDREIVDAVNRRIVLVEELWRLKEERGAPRVDPERERRLRATLAAANRGPLSSRGLDELVDALLELTKHELG
jgi:chorismate mutase